eukprot:27726-Amphidinium_carterae.1
MHRNGQFPSNHMPTWLVNEIINNKAVSHWPAGCVMCSPTAAVFTASAPSLGLPNTNSPGGPPPPLLTSLVPSR